MKLALNIGSLAVIGLFSVTTLAQTAVRVKPAEVRPEITVRPNASTKGLGLEGSYLKSVTEQAGARPDLRCGGPEFASGLSDGTGVSYVNTKAIVDAGLLNEGACDVVKFGLPARRNLLEAELCTLNAGGDKVSLAQRNGSIRPPCYKAAFDNDEGAQTTTLASAQATIAQLFKSKAEGGCQILQ